VKKYCEAAGTGPRRLGGHGSGIHPLRKTAINDAIRNKEEAGCLLEVGSRHLGRTK